MLKPEVSLGVGMATAVGVFAIYQMALPSIADVRSLERNNRDITASEKMATWTAAAAVAGISLVTRDTGVFTIGGLTIVALAWWHRHANLVDPLTGKASDHSVGAPVNPQVTQEESPQLYAVAGTDPYSAAI